MPRWLNERLRYAPMVALTALTALTAMEAPEIVMTQGKLVETWRDPRIFGAVAGLGWGVTT